MGGGGQGVQQTMYSTLLSMNVLYRLYVVETFYCCHYSPYPRNDKSYYATVQIAAPFSFFFQDADCSLIDPLQPLIHIDEFLHVWGCIHNLLLWVWT